MIGVIVVYYRAGYETLNATLTAALAEPEAAAERLVVVDNDSGDGCAAAVCADTGTRLLTLPSNNGFASAVRAGLSHLPRDLDPILVLTHECVLHPGALTLLNRALEDDVGITAPRLTLSGGQRWSDGGSFGGVLRRPHHEITDTYDRRTVDWVDGAAMLCRRGLINEIPTTYGMYFEDVELGWIAKQRMLRVVVVGDALAVQATQGIPDLGIGRGWVTLQRRTRGRAAAALTTGAILAMAGRRLMQRDTEGARALIRGACLGWKTVLGAAGHG